jgi:hypothetical protein
MPPFAAALRREAALRSPITLLLLPRGAPIMTLSLAFCGLDVSLRPGGYVRQREMT